MYVQKIMKSSIADILDMYFVFPGRQRAEKIRSFWIIHRD